MATLEAQHYLSGRCWLELGGGSAVPPPLPHSLLLPPLTKFSLNHSECLLQFPRHSHSKPLYWMPGRNWCPHRLAALFHQPSGSPLQCSCLENPVDRGAWWAPVHGVTKDSGMTGQARMCHTFSISPVSGYPGSHPSRAAV